MPKSVSIDPHQIMDACGLENVGNLLRIVRRNQLSLEPSKNFEVLKSTYLYGLGPAIHQVNAIFVINDFPHRIE